MRNARPGLFIGLTAMGALAIAGADEPAATDSQRETAELSIHHVDESHKPPRPVGKFVRTVRQATARYRDVQLAEADGYHLHFGCVTGSDAGAMGLHYVNMDLVGDGVLDPARPEIVIYEPLPGGRLKLIGADFLVLAEQWHAENAAPPELGGQLLHLFESPNRFGLPAFYTLHVWAWKDNPSGMFTNWHSRVSCATYSGA